MLRAQAELLQQSRGGAGMAELVVDTDTNHLGGQLLAEQAADRLAQTADDGVLLAGDDLAALFGGREHQLLIQGFDGSHVDDHGVNALSRQRLGGHDGFIDHQAVGDDGNVGAVAHNLALANFKLVAFLMEDGHRRPAEAHIHRAHIFVGGLHHGLGLHIVGGAHDHHAGDGAHQSEVLAALVAGTVLTYGDAAVGSADLHIQVGIADGVAHLLIGTSGGEHGEGGSEGHQAGGGHTGSHADHIRLGNAAVKVTVGEGLLENAGLGSTGQIRVQDYQVFVLGTQLRQGVAIAVTGCDFLYVCHITCPPVLPGSPSARSWPARTRRHSVPCRASPPDSP